MRREMEKQRVEDEQRGKKRRKAMKKREGNKKIANRKENKRQQRRRGKREGVTNGKIRLHKAQNYGSPLLRCYEGREISEHR